MNLLARLKFWWNGPELLLTMRLIDMHIHHPQQDNQHSCSQCNQPVGIYPSGQHAMRKFPKMKLVCNHCYSGSGADYARPAPGAMEELIESRRQ